MWLLGLAYKKNTGDARESPAVRVAELLLRVGAPVRAADPLVTEPTVIDQAVARVDATLQEIAAADIVVLLTDHDAFPATDVCRYARYVLDWRRVLVRSERRDAVGRCPNRTGLGACHLRARCSLGLSMPRCL